MSAGTIVAIIVVIVVVAFLAMGMVLGARRRALRRRFGPEYDRVVSEGHSRRQAGAELLERERRVQGFQLRELSTAAADKYLAQWADVQERFVDVPTDAIADAQRLLESVMVDRGYPVAGFDQAAADLSVRHPRTVEGFRSAHDISQRASAGQTTTEDLRVAMLAYRQLFSELLGVGAIASRPAMGNANAQAAATSDQTASR
jgi:hypothetical protein